MSKPIISIEGLGKSYLVGHESTRNERYTALRDVVAKHAKSLGRKALDMARGRQIVQGDVVEEFWALKNVSFDVGEGEVVGIIGHNGAGKSTLLKVLSRITEPTQGRITLRGRVASLLEVGTGFHPELTGRENVYLNGAILGMTRSEIKEKFDNIVGFAGVERFLDTPVKRYSSGMYVRLAFAVAAHLDPEILIVDEVLAVGDGEFQKKCLGKMKDVAAGGRTVLIVSHQMNMIASLCDRAVVLQKGSVAFNGAVNDAVLHYQSSSGPLGQAMFDAERLGKKIGNEKAQLHRAWLESVSGKCQQIFDMDEPMLIRMEYSVTSEAAKFLYPNFHVFDDKGQHVFVTAAVAREAAVPLNLPGRWVATCTIPGRLLNTGTFSVGVAMTAMDPGVSVAFFERDALTIQVSEDLDRTLDGVRNGYAGVVPGPVRPSLVWKIEKCG